MGTRGYRVYRYKGWYHVYYNHYDSYPSGLGLEVAAEVPVDDEKAYNEWLEKLRETLDDHFEKNKDVLEKYIDCNTITRKQPRCDIWIEWMYEIDIDHEVFLVDGNPLFALNNMPNSKELFLECIGLDSFGHRGYSLSTPIKHRYNWKSTPPLVDDCIIDDYNARLLTADHVELSITELLGVPSAPASVGSCEAVRIELYEVLFAQMMQAWTVGHYIRLLEAVPDRTSIPNELYPVAVTMIKAAIGRMLFSESTESTQFQEEEEDSPKAKQQVEEFTWLTPDICMRITTHLDDERNLKKALLELLDEVAVRRQPGNSFAYGILFSFFHCVIVQVDPSNGFKSTAALQFLPDFYATSPSTAGVTAIARLAYHCFASAKTVVVNTLPPDHFLNKVPLDVIEHIAENLDLVDLRSFRAVTPLFKPATETLLRYPFAGNYRLLHVVEESASHNSCGDYCEELPPNHDALRDCKTFSAMVGSTFMAAVIVGLNRRRGTRYISVVFDDEILRIGYGEVTTVD